MPLELKRVRALTKALFVRAQTAGYRARTKVCAIIDTHTHTHTFMRVSLSIGTPSLGKRSHTFMRASFSIGTHVACHLLYLSICESAAFYQLCHKAIYAFRTGTGSRSCLTESVNCFYGKVGKTLRSHSII